MKISSIDDARSYERVLYALRSLPQGKAVRSYVDDVKRNLRAFYHRPDGCVKIITADYDNSMIKGGNQMPKLEFTERSTGIVCRVYHYDENIFRKMEADGWKLERVYEDFLYFSKEYDCLVPKESIAVGTTLWVAFMRLRSGYDVYPVKVIRFCESRLWDMCCVGTDPDGRAKTHYFKFADIGRNVFLTQAEAQQRATELNKE